MTNSEHQLISVAIVHQTSADWICKCGEKGHIDWDAPADLIQAEYEQHLPKEPEAS